MNELEIVERLQFVSAEFRNSGFFQVLSPLLDSASEIILEKQEYTKVVRCKDCKYSGMYAFGCGDTEKLACLEIEEDGFIRFASAVDPNGFCSKGERRAADEKES